MIIFESFFAHSWCLIFFFPTIFIIIKISQPLWNIQQWFTTYNLWKKFIVSDHKTFTADFLRKLEKIKEQSSFLSSNEFFMNAKAHYKTADLLLSRLENLISTLNCVQNSTPVMS